MFAICLTSCLLGSNPMTALHTYNPVDSGIVVEISLPDQSGVGHLWLLDHENQLLADPVVVIGGTQDLIGRMPRIKELQVATWLQLVVDNEPVGVPLVLQPMISREVPSTAEETRADGKTAYTKIVGWQNEAEEGGIIEPLL